MGVDMYYVEMMEREKGYDKGYENGQKSMAEQIKELSKCQEKMKNIKKIYENDEPFKALKIKKIIYDENDNTLKPKKAKRDYTSEKLYDGE